MAISAQSRSVVGHYRLRKKLLRDDVGTLYLARHVDLGRDVAIKLIPVAENLASETWAEIHSRFLREARAAGRLRHSNILSVWDAGEQGRYMYIVMDYVAGDRLDSYTDPDNLLPVGTVLYIGRQMAGVLDYAHSMQVIHRDIKPQNIIFAPGERGAILTGFGIARLLDSSQTRTGIVRGSPSYMSPEQVMGKKAGPLADIYSLGVTLYQLSTGWLPFVADSITELMDQIVNKEPRKLRDLRAELAPCLVQIIEKAMTKDPGARFRSGAEMAQALQDCADSFSR